MCNPEGIGSWGLKSDRKEWILTGGTGRGMGVLFGTIGGRMTVGLKTSKRICGNLQFLSMSLTSERILVYSEAAL